MKKFHGMMTTINWNNISSEVVKQYWQRSLCLLSLDVTFTEKKRDHIMNIMGSCPKLLLSMMKYDKRAQPMSDREMWFYYACIRPLTIDIAFLAWSIASTVIMLNTMMENKKSFY